MSSVVHQHGGHVKNVTEKVMVYRLQQMGFTNSIDKGISEKEGRKELGGKCQLTKRSIKN